MSNVLGLEPGGGWQAMNAQGVREFLEVARDDAVVFDLPESIVLFVDVDALEKHSSARPVVALARQRDGLGPLSAHQEAWIRGWTETMKRSTRREILEAVLS